MADNLQLRASTDDRIPRLAWWRPLLLILFILGGIGTWIVWGLARSPTRAAPTPTATITRPASSLDVLKKLKGTYSGVQDGAPPVVVTQATPPPGPDMSDELRRRDTQIQALQQMIEELKKR